jgi:gamma-glutamylcyclotransferase
MRAGYDLAFIKRSQKDGSGKATLETGQQDDRAHGVLYRIDCRELALLDAAEGRGVGYERDDAFPVIRTDSGETVVATTYLATDVDATLMPYEWYYVLISAEN